MDEQLKYMARNQLWIHSGSYRLCEPLAIQTAHQCTYQDWKQLHNQFDSGQSWLRFYSDFIDQLIDELNREC